MKWKVSLRPRAQKEFQKLPKSLQARVVSRLERLAEDPFGPGSDKLAGHENLWRIRLGDYRIIFEPKKEILLITVIRIGDRKEVYRGL